MIMKKLSVTVVISLLFMSVSSFATVRYTDKTSTTAGAESAAISGGMVGPGKGSSVSEAYSVQEAGATVSANSTTIGSILPGGTGIKNSISGNTYAAGDVGARSETTGNGYALSGATGASGATANALAAGSRLVLGGHPVNGTVTGGAESHNSNGAATISSGGSEFIATQQSWNESTVSGNTSSNFQNGVATTSVQVNRTTAGDFTSFTTPTVLPTAGPILNGAAVSDLANTGASWIEAAARAGQKQESTSQ